MKGLRYIKLPKFGWFAFDETLSSIRALYDLGDQDSIVAFFQYLIKEKKQYHEVGITYSEMSIIRLSNDYYIYKGMQAFHNSCIEELHNGQLFHDGKYINLAKFLKDEGKEAFLNTGLGLITDKTIKASTANLPITIKNKLIIPTYCTPQHPCSFEAFTMAQLHKRDTVYINSEKGWYGKLDNTILSDFNKLQYNDGCTWDYKADYWMSKPVDIDTSMDVTQCIKIWTEAKRTIFTNSPLDIIEINKKVPSLKHNLKNLNYNQIKELEKRFGADLLSYWQNQQFEEISIGQLKFIQKDKQYYVERNGVVEEFTNFTMDIHKVVKKDDRYVRIGCISFYDHYIPFEFDNRVFLSCKAFLKRLNEFFFENNIGIPIILNSYQGMIIDVINRFNRNRIKFDS